MNDGKRKSRLPRVVGGVAILAILLVVGWPYMPTALLDRVYELTASTEYEDWYPQDIAPPKGTSYPCALTALPRDLPGIPPTERGYINHTYSKILEATQLKLVILQEVAADDGGLHAELSTYKSGTEKALAAIRSEEPPPGLRAFKADVVAAIELQQQFFAEAVDVRDHGGSFDDVIAIPAGKSASGLLLQAWARMQKRYPSWSAAMKDSVYHHLCALDLF